jgi:hypothetical protein
MPVFVMQRALSAKEFAYGPEQALDMIRYERERMRDAIAQEIVKALENNTEPAYCRLEFTISDDVANRCKKMEYRAQVESRVYQGTGVGQRSLNDDEMIECGIASDYLESNGFPEAARVLRERLAGRPLPGAIKQLASVS